MGATAVGKQPPQPPPTSRPRKTLAAEIGISGRGVHSGIVSSLTLCPAEADSGICFSRTDLPGQPVIPVTYDHLAIEELDRRTTLRTPDAAVHTVEHVLSALAAAEIHDALIKINAPEPPFADGSALPYTQLIHRVGHRTHGAPVLPIVIPRPLAFRFRDAEICAIPASEYRISFYFTSDHPNLRSQAHSFEVTTEAYATEIAPARTFCFFEEIEQLRLAGLIKGASLASAVVIGRKGIINDTIRFPDEPVRHKILDFIGDMALLGSPLQGHFMAWRAGHRVNAEFGMHLKKELNL